MIIRKRALLLCLLVWYIPAAKPQQFSSVKKITKRKSELAPLLGAGGALLLGRGLAQQTFGKNAITILGATSLILGISCWTRNNTKGIGVHWKRSKKLKWRFRGVIFACHLAGAFYVWEPSPMSTPSKVICVLSTALSLSFSALSASPTTKFYWTTSPLDKGYKNFLKNIILQKQKKRRLQELHKHYELCIQYAWKNDRKCNFSVLPLEMMAEIFSYLKYEGPIVSDLKRSDEELLDLQDFRPSIDFNRYTDEANCLIHNKKTALALDDVLEMYIPIKYEWLEWYIEYKKNKMSLIDHLMNYVSPKLFIKDVEKLMEELKLEAAEKNAD